MLYAIVYHLEHVAFAVAAVKPRRVILVNVCTKSVPAVVVCPHKGKLYFFVVLGL